MTSRTLILAADFGTTGVKLGAFARDLGLVAWVKEPYETALPGYAAAEQLPDDWWNSLRRAVEALAPLVPDLREKVAAVVFCAQMCGVICTDESGRPLRPCLIWLDKRAARTAQQLAGGFPSFHGYGVVKLARWLRLANGAPSLNGADPTAKMRWLKEHEPAVWNKTHKVLDVKDWLVHRATGRFTTTADSANLTWMMDTRRGRIGWSDELIEQSKLRRAVLPDLVDGTAIVGQLREDAAAELGLSAGVPVVAGSGDVVATAIGSGAVADGALHIHVGSSSWIAGFFPSRRLNVDPPYATITSAASHRPLLIATQETSGECLSWAARTFNAGLDGEQAVQAMLSAAAKCEPSKYNPIFLPWLMGERMPVDDARLRGAFLGMSLDHDTRHMAFAVIEGMALNLRWAFEKVGRERSVKAGPLPIVGGVVGSPFVARLFATALQRELLLVREPVAAGMRGAAALAATGIGWSSSPWAAAASYLDGARMIEPDRALSALYHRRFALFRDAYRATRPWFRNLLS